MLTLDSRDVWGALAHTLRPYIARRVASTADVDDVLQETLLRLHKGVGGLRDDERFGPWVYRVARSAVADHRRARERHPLTDRDAPDAPEEGEDAREFTCDIHRYMGDLVALLPEPAQTAVRRVELDGASQAEVAREMGVPLSTVKSRVQRGRARLRAMVERICAVTLDARGRVVACRSKGDPCCGPITEPAR